MHDALPGPKFVLKDSQEYYDDLLKKLPKAKERIVIAAMILLWGEKTDALFMEIEKALQRGVRVHVLLDNFTRLGTSNPGLNRSALRVQLKKTFLLLERFKELGAKTTIVGKIGMNPFKGRCHVKVTIIDNNVYSFGGVNFSDLYFTHSDYMLHTNDEDVADCLEQLVTHLANAPTFLPDAEVAFGMGETILFDGGEPRHSLIYGRALELATESRQVYFVSQMAPSGALAQALRKVNTKYYFNRPEQMPAPARWGQAFDQQRYHIPNSYSRSEFIHAKFMLFELHDGTHVVLSGSNNFSYRGVAFGTKELALYSTDKKLWQALYKFIETKL